MLDFARWSLFLIGHVGIWAFLFNRSHSTAMIRSIRKASERAAILVVTLPAIWIAVRILTLGSIGFDTVLGDGWFCSYAAVCSICGSLLTIAWAIRKIKFRLPKKVKSTNRQILDLRNELKAPIYHGTLPKLLEKIPFNECHKLSLQNMEFELEMPKNLAGLKICHLSDLHYTGQIDIGYFQRVIAEVNRFDPDLVVITGDIVDSTDCLEWISETLGQIQAKSKAGIYYVLGNHDRRVGDEQKLRQLLSSAGMVQASGTWHDIQWNGATIRITGTALPWFYDSKRLGPEPDSACDLKILLSHSPDQIGWAVQHQADLMFAGHTHGGQISLPIIGPVIAPSYYGVTFASGTFDINGTLMHVSRGLSGDESIRIGSPPELGCFSLTANPQATESKPVLNQKGSLDTAMVQSKNQLEGRKSVKPIAARMKKINQSKMTVG
ncbi:MAG: metallophosphoesterase [Planctomycetota bacterium]